MPFNMQSVRPHRLHLCGTEVATPDLDLIKGPEKGSIQDATELSSNHASGELRHARSQIATVHRPPPPPGGVLIFVVPLPQIWRLQVPIRRKFAVAGAFLLGSLGVFGTSSTLCGPSVTDHGTASSPLASSVRSYFTG